MPDVDILISNYNGREAVQLCVESIARYTPEPHRVIVYDDHSDNLRELEYLTHAQGRGWVNEIIVGDKHAGHGVALNALVGLSAASYAVLMDNDIQILRKGWLTDLLVLVEDPRILIAASEKNKFSYCSRGYMPGQFLPWFALLNMTAYRDGMQIDWSTSELSRKDEPWQTECAHLYPPDGNPLFKQTRATWGAYAIDFDPDKIIFDPGCVLWCKMRHDNPKGYIHRELPPALLASFRHWGHAQSWLDQSNVETSRGQAIKQQIATALQTLRQGI